MILSVWSGLVRDEEAADWNSDKLRPIAESLYATLLSRHRSVLSFSRVTGVVEGSWECSNES